MYDFRPARRLDVMDLIVMLAVASSCRVAVAEAAYQVQWTEQIGTWQDDRSESVAIDAFGNAFISGITYSGLDGNTFGGDRDAFLTKYDASGTKLWTRQIGEAGAEESHAVAVDQWGNAYITGSTTGGLDGNTHAGSRDTFLIKFDPSGTKLWTDQLGTAGIDVSHAVAVDGSGNVYISGMTEGDLGGETNAGGRDVFLTRYSPSGIEQWTRLIGNSRSNESWAVALDALGNAYISGQTFGGLDGHSSIGSYDAFLTKYDPTGNKMWTKLVGSAEIDYSRSVAVDALGNTYISGGTQGGIDGNTHAGDWDTFLTKYGPSGTKLWTRQLGTFREDFSRSVSVDGSGNVFITGFTEYDLDGNENANPFNEDAFLTKYDPSGNKLWTKLIGTEQNDAGFSVATDVSGNVYISGRTFGNLNGNTNSGDYDAFLVKLTAAVNGDLDDDGFVGISDLTLVLGAWNQNVPPANLLADPSGDGFVGIDDLNLVLGNWNAGTPPGSPTHIPEPVSLAWLTVGGIALLANKR